MGKFYYCEICYIELANEKLIDQHRSTQKHLDCEKFRQESESDKNSTSTCYLCCREMNSPEILKEHLKSDSHKKKEYIRDRIERFKAQQQEPITYTVVNSIREYQDGSGEIFYECVSCGFRTYRIKELCGHLESAEHRIRIDQANNNRPETDNNVNNVFCNVCSIDFQDKNHYLNHLATESHREQVVQKSLLDKFGRKNGKNPVIKTIDIYKENETKNETEKNVAFCKHCELRFEKKEDYLNHIESESHAEKVRISILAPKKAEEKNSPTQVIHVPSKPLTRSQTSMELSSVSSIPESIREIYESSLEWCSCCYVRYPSNAQRETHLRGRDHLKKLIMKEITLKKPEASAPKFFCDICYSENNSAEQLEAHKKSFAHLDVLKRKEEYLKYEAAKSNSKPSITKSRTMYSFEPEAKKPAQSKIEPYKSLQDGPTTKFQTEQPLFNQFNLKKFKFIGQNEFVQPMLIEQKVINEIEKDIDDLFQQMHDECRNLSNN